MEQNTELLCVDCANGFRKWHDIVLMTPKKHSLRCRKSLKEESIKIDPVIGPERRSAEHELCVVARMSSGSCGYSAKNWEPKDKQHIFLAIKHSDK